MTQLNFDEKGFLKPQKVKFNVEHNEVDKEAINQVELEQELLKGLNILAPGDRDIKALTIWVNPNYIYGPDYLVQEKLEKILKKLIDKKIVLQEKSTPKFNIFSLVKSKNVCKNGV